MEDYMIMFWFGVSVGIFIMSMAQRFDRRAARKHQDMHEDNFLERLGSAFRKRGVKTFIVRDGGRGDEKEEA